MMLKLICLTNITTHYNMDFSKYQFRCSALGHLMSEPMGDSNLVKWQKAAQKHSDMIANAPNRYNKDGVTQSKLYDKWLEKGVEQTKIVEELAKIKDEVQLSDGAKTHLMDIWISETKRRKADINNKFIEKGLAMEEDGITLYSRVKKVFFVKNETHLHNQFIKGTPDSFIGQAIHEATRIIDIKCSWSANTFYRTFTKKLNELYYWQGMGYMWLTGAKYFDLAYCLVNTPQSLIDAEIRSLWYKLGQPSEDDANWQDAQFAIQKNMVYDDIPLRERVLEYTIEYSESEIELLKKKVTKAREYLNWLDNEFAVKFAA